MEILRIFKNAWIDLYTYIIYYGIIFDTCSLTLCRVMSGGRRLLILLPYNLDV